MRKDTNFPAGPGAATVSSLLQSCLSMDVRHPRDVLSAPGIAPQEKRAILASWASDMFAVESRPNLRLYPEAKEPVSYEEIIEALKALDEDDQLHRHVAQDRPVMRDDDTTHPRSEPRRPKSQAAWKTATDFCRRPFLEQRRFCR